MRIVSQAELARMAGVSRMAVTLAIQRRRIHSVECTDGSTGVDLDEDRTRAYLQRRGGQRRKGQRKSGRRPSA
jgi:hypothetical protein